MEERIRDEFTTEEEAEEAYVKYLVDAEDMSTLSRSRFQSLMR